MDKYFNFEFIRTESGWIDFEVSIQTITFRYSFSNVISTQPEELIVWLEKIYNKEYCEFECDTEGMKFWFNYDGENFYVYDPNNILNENTDKEKYLHGVIKISRLKLCKTIYKAFRDFVVSKKYKKVEWQDETSFEETLIDAYGSLDEAIEIVSSKSLEDFYDDYIERTGFSKYLTQFSLFIELENQNLPFYMKEYRIKDTYNAADISGKRDIIRKYISDVVFGYDGGKLREIKSDILEDLIKES